jgi:hypothetical protein
MKTGPDIHVNKKKQTNKILWILWKFDTSGGFYFSNSRSFQDSLSKKKKDENPFKIIEGFSS